MLFSTQLSFSYISVSLQSAMTAPDKAELLLPRCICVCVCFCMCTLHVNVLKQIGWVEWVCFVFGLSVGALQITQKRYAAAL